MNPLSHLPRSGLVAPGVAIAGAALVLATSAPPSAAAWFGLTAVSLTPRARMALRPSVQRRSMAGARRRGGGDHLRARGDRALDRARAARFARGDVDPGEPGRRGAARRPARGAPGLGVRGALHRRRGCADGAKDTFRNLVAECSVMQAHTTAGWPLWTPPAWPARKSNTAYIGVTAWTTIGAFGWHSRQNSTTPANNRQ